MSELIPFSRDIGLGSSSVHPDAKPDKTLKNSAVIILALDFDEAGAKCSRWWTQQYPQAKRWPVFIACAFITINATIPADLITIE